MSAIKRLLVLSLLLGLGVDLAAWAKEDDGLVAHYAFDEGQGAALKDRSGHGNNGTVFGAPEWVKLNKGGALKFNGKDNWVEVPASASLNIAHAGTLEVWLNPAAHQGGVASWHLGPAWEDERLVLAWYREPGLACYMSDGNFVARGVLSPVPLNQWTCVTATWNKAKVQLFLDGQRIQEFQMRGMLDLGGAPLRIGQSCGLAESQYRGLIDDVKIYSRALSEAEVLDSYATAAPDHGKTVAPGTKELKAWTRVLIEGEPQIVLTVDVAEFRPIAKGMTLEAEFRGTTVKKSVALNAREWRYEVTLPAETLAPGVCTLAIRVNDASGLPTAPETVLQIPWRKLSTRPCIAADDSAKAESVFSLVRDGQGCATIVVPDPPDKWTQTSADWLAQYIKESTGAALPIVPERSAPAGNLISIGQTQLWKKAGLTLDGLQYDGGRMVVRGNTLFLFGRDDFRFDREAPKGTCRTVTQFLEDCVGVRWFLPGPEGTMVPQRTNVAVARTLDRTCNPEFGFAHGRYPYGVNTAAGLANNFRTGIKIRSYGGNAYYTWLPAEKYFKDHPEYFALIGGKRTAAGNHLCSSNPDVAKILLDCIRKDFDQGYDWVELSQEDGYVRCECERCEALDNFRGDVRPETPCERLLLLHKWIVDECRKSHPGKTVQLLVYGPTTWPSKKFAAWGDTVVAEMCSWEPEIIAAWKGKVRAMSGYIYWFDTTSGAGMSIHATAAEVAEKMRYLHVNGYVGLYQCIETNWGLEGPVYYIMAKLMADPYLDYRELQKEYCLGLFGKEAGETMNRFYNTLYVMPGVHTYFWPEEAVGKLDALLAQARQQAQAGRPQQWVKLVSDQFEFSKDFSRVLTSYRAYEESRNDQTWATLKRSVEEFEAYRERILNYPDEQTDRFFPGYDQFCRFLASKYVGYYESYKAKRATVLKTGVRGTPVGWSIGKGLGREPLGMDFTKPPPHAAQQR